MVPGDWLPSGRRRVPGELVQLLVVSGRRGRRGRSSGLLWVFAPEAGGAGDVINGDVGAPPRSDWPPAHLPPATRRPSNLAAGQTSIRNCAPSSSFICFDYGHHHWRRYVMPRWLQSFGWDDEHLLLLLPPLSLSLSLFLFLSLID